MDGGFFFVDGINPDRASKRLMRRHVMKGKNAGKTFHRQSRPGLVKQRPKSAIISSNFNIPKHCQDQGLGPSNVISRKLGNSFSPCAPVEVDSYSLKIIDDFFTFTINKIYPVRLGMSTDGIKATWLRVFFADEAAYHCNIALMQASNEVFQGHGHSSPKSLYHLSRSFSWVKQKLESGDALSDATFGIVMSLITQEQIRNEHISAKIHFDGLRRMVELRGGLAQLEGSLMLLLKVCKIDIIFSIQKGTRPKFFRNRMSETQSTLASKGIYLGPTSDMPLIGQEKLHPHLNDVLVDVRGFCSFFNTSPRTTEIDILTLQEMLVSMGYRLLDFHLIKYPNQLCNMEAIYHLGLMLFLATIWLQHDCQQILEFELTYHCFQVVLDSISSGCESELVLWFTIVGGIWTCGGTDKDWFTKKLRKIAEQMNLETWDEAVHYIQKFPWIKSVHDKPGHELWDHMA